MKISCFSLCRGLLIWIGRVTRLKIRKKKKKSFCSIAFCGSYLETNKVKMSFSEQLSKI